jgi:hypothetical protein
LREARARVSTLDEDSLALEYGDDRLALVVVVRLRGAGRVELRVAGGTAGGWSVVLSTEDAGLAAHPQPVSIDHEAGVVRLSFSRPGGVLLRAEELPRR